MTKEKSNIPQVVKMKQGMSYSCKEKTIILNVFKYFRNAHPQYCVTEIVRRTAKATGCSEKSVFQFRKEEASVEGFKQPSKTKIRKSININSRFVKYDDNVRQGIRNIIYDLKFRNIVPSLSTILKNVNANDKLPNFSLMTLRRLLSDMGFCYEREKTGSKPVLVEKPTVKKDNIPVINKKSQQIVKQNVNSVSTMHNKIDEPKQEHQSNIIPQQNYTYLPNDNQILSSTALPHDNHYMEPPRDPPMYLPHDMMMSQRIPHQIPPVHQNMHLKSDANFMHQGIHYPHNMIMPH